MPVRRISSAVLLYVVLALAQAAAVLIAGGGSLSVPAAALSLALFAGLALGQPLAWMLLLALNTLGLLAWIVVLLAHLGGHLLWGNILLIGLTTLAMEAALISPGLRRHVASRGLRLAPPSGSGPATVSSRSAAGDWPAARHAAARESGGRRSSAEPPRP